MCDAWLGIYWCQFDWPTFATLATGFMAVLAAFVVGRRQVVIMGRQTLLTELSLREATFERRFAVYRVVREFLSTMAIGGLPPDTGQWEDFMGAWTESKFLFQKGVSQELSHFRQVADDFAFNHKQSENEALSDEARLEHLEKRNKLKEELLVYLRSLDALFGREMELSAPRSDS